MAMVTLLLIFIPLVAGAANTTSEPVDWTYCENFDYYDHDGLTEDHEHCGEDVIFRLSPRNDEDVPKEAYHIDEEICIRCNISGRDLLEKDLYFVMREQNASTKQYVMFQGNSTKTRVEGATVDKTTVQYCFTRHEATKIKLMCCAEQPSHPLQCCCDRHEDNSEALSLVIDKVWEHPIESCIVKNWEKLECRWKDNDFGPIMHTITPFYRKKNNQNWLKVPKDKIIIDRSKAQHKFYLNFPEDISLQSYYCFVVNATKKNLEQHRASQPLCARGLDIVQPDAVGGLKAVRVASTEVELEWINPKAKQSLLYNVTYTCQLTDSISITKVLLVRMVGARLKNLQPACQYSLSVRGMPANGGLWSEKATTQFSTSEDIPGENPDVAPVFSEDRDPNTSGRTITIYWKGVPRIKWHGSLFYIVERYSGSETVPFNYTNQSNRASMLRGGNLAWRQKYLFRVYAWTRKGKNDSLPVANVSIPSLGKSLDRVDEVVVVLLNNSKVSIMWSASPKLRSVTSAYTVFWCMGTRHGQCQDPDWETIPGTRMNWTISLPKGASFPDYKFGVAVRDDHRVSPLKWGSCHYMWNADVAVPNITVHGTRVEFVDTVNCKNTVADKGFTYRYIVWVCSTRQGCGKDKGNKYIVEKITDYFSLPNLSPQEGYYVVAAGISFPENKMSERSAPVHFFTGGLKWWWWLLIVLAGIVVLLVASIGLWCCWKTQKACIRKMLQLPVEHPREPEVIANGTLGQGYNYPFKEFETTFEGMELDTPPDSGEQVLTALLPEGSGETAEISDYSILAKSTGTEATDELLASSGGEEVEEVEDYETKLDQPSHDAAIRVQGVASVSPGERYTRTPRKNSYGSNSYGGDEYQGATSKQPAHEEYFDSANAGSAFSITLPAYSAISVDVSSDKLLLSQNGAENSQAQTTGSNMMQKNTSITVDDYPSDEKNLLPRETEHEVLSVDNPVVDIVEDYSPSTKLDMSASNEDKHSLSDHSEHSVSESNLNSGNLSVDDYTLTNVIIPPKYNQGSGDHGDGNKDVQMAESVESIDYHGASVIAIPNGDHSPNHALNTPKDSSMQPAIPNNTHMELPAVLTSPGHGDGAYPCDGNSVDSGSSDNYCVSDLRTGSPTHNRAAKC